MSSTKWILSFTWTVLLPITFSRECVYSVKDLTVFPMFSLNDTVLPTNGYAMIIRTPPSNQSCILSLRNLPLSLFQDGVAIYYLICRNMFPVNLDTEGIPETSSPILYLKIENCLLGLDGIRKFEEIYDLKVLSYIDQMPSGESLQFQNESQNEFQNGSKNESRILGNIAAYNIVLNSFSEKQPWIFTINDTFPSLAELSLGGIGLENLPPDMNLRFPNLQSIELVKNRFTYVPELEFSSDLYPIPLGLKRTPEMQDYRADSIGIDVDPSFFGKILILDENLISSLDDFSFNGTLHKISVSKNKLVNISSRTFANVQGLNVLDLSHNLLSFLPVLAFQNCEDLLYLKLNSNNISEIPADSFKNNQRLLKLDLSKNNLTDLELGVFGNLTSLKYLDLSHNNLKEFKSEVLPEDFGSLEELKLHNNNLRNLPVEFFRHNRLRLIDLHDCQITIENFTDILDSLQIMDTNSSDVAGIRTTETGINLSDNLINRLDFGNFSESESNTKKMYMLLENFKLDFSRNPIECDCHLLPLLDFFQKAKEDEIYSGEEYFYQNWKCKYPLGFEDFPILSLTKEDLHCEEPIPDCPKECLCYQRPMNKMVIVDCRRQQLTSLPNKMPPGNLEIWLQHNNISRLEQRNYLQRIEILNMNYNRISDLNAVKNFKHLKRAYFYSNILITLPSSIRELPLISLNVSRNHFLCDCDNLWLKSWLLRVKDKVQGWFDIKCLTYAGNIRAITDTSDTDFKCISKEGFLAKHIEIVEITILVIAMLACILIFVRLKKRNSYIC